MRDVGESSELWHQAYAAVGPSRDQMWDWLEAKYLSLLAERDEVLSLWHCTPEDKQAMDENLLKVYRERDEARRERDTLRREGLNDLTNTARKLNESQAEIAQLRGALQEIFALPVWGIDNRMAAQGIAAAVLKTDE